MTADRLHDGTDVNVRAIRPSDAAALIRFHDELSPDSQRSRFFIVHPHLTAKEVERFTSVDHRDREAFVAVAGPEILGVGRYERLPGADDAEVAFVTRDDHQRSGIAMRLFDALATAAHAVGIKRFVAETLPENHKMLALFTRTGLVTRRSFGRDAVEITMSLPGELVP
jgi:RimJ/RimL family protein N-acetyltransferase